MTPSPKPISEKELKEMEVRLMRQEKEKAEDVSEIHGTYDIEHNGIHFAFLDQARESLRLISELKRLRSLETQNKILRDAAEKCLDMCIGDHLHGDMMALSTHVSNRLAKALKEADAVKEK